MNEEKDAERRDLEALGWKRRLGSIGWTVLEGCRRWLGMNDVGSAEVNSGLSRERWDVKTVIILGQRRTSLVC